MGRMLVAGCLLAGLGGAALAQDAISDRVGATAGQFRVDESGAASYSIPILTVPGTAGVSPQVALSYSSQGGDGPVGRGWSISGLSAITRCRATREAGDIIVSGVPQDGTPPAVDFSTNDRFCMDGQRLIPAPAGAPACPGVSGFTASNLRTQSESFQRVCAYVPTATSANGPAFFSVERQDGSTSFYGNRDDWTASATRPDGYVNSTAATHTTKALSWWQTRFMDSTGNYIDYRYTSNPGGASYPGESVIASIEYTGKKQLTGQTGGNLTPYAKVQFNYAARPTTEFARGSISGGVVWQTRYLASITSIGDIATNQQARFYSLGYATSVSGSGARTLTQVTECRDSTMAVCLSPTTLAWSSAVNSFSSTDTVTSAGFDGMVSMRLGDVDGDGLTDVVWFKPSAGRQCNYDLLVSFGELNASGQLTFNRVSQTSWCFPRSITASELNKAWHLLDYNGDGRDDLFVAGAGTNWSLFPSLGRPTSGGTVFNFAGNLLAGLSPGIAITNNGIFLTDMNGDGLLDVMFRSTNGEGALFQVRLMERSGSNFIWGSERAVVLEELDATPRTYLGLVDPRQRLQMYDFDGDSRSDLVLSVRQRVATGLCPPQVTDPPEEHIASDGRRWYQHPAIVWDEDSQENWQGRNGPCFLNIIDAQAFGVVNITAAQVTLRMREHWQGSHQEYDGNNVHTIVHNSNFHFADFNGDGITDALMKNTTSGWIVDLTGIPGTHTVAASFPNEDYLQLADVNGDGRVDILFPQQANNNYRPFHGYIARPDGTFPATPSLVSGGNARGCKNTTCNLANTYFLFSDFDGDGATDFVALYDNSVEHYSSRAPAASRYQPRDTVTAITDGHGATTQLTYRPLTLADAYRRDTGARALNWGRGSPVQELFGPQYVVVRAQSSAPVYGNAAALSAVHYRYAGARVQAGGGGLLGFRQIQSFDTTPAGSHIVTTSTYRQDAPYAGVPLETVRRAVSGTHTLPSCLSGTVTNACFQAPGTSFPAIGGTLIAQSTSVWETSPAFSPGTQTPVHVRLSGSDERVHALNSGALTSRVLTTLTYGTYGFATGTSVDTYNSANALVSRVQTTNNYTHITSPWRLGRLSSSTVTHTRGASSTSRSTSFTYDTTGAATGQLISERIQPGGSADQDLRTFHTLDAFGNRTHTYTCSNHLTEAACKSTAVTFQSTTADRIHRYARSTYDSRGRFATATYSPYWNGSGTVEQMDGQILSRNLFGDVTHARDIRGVDSIATYGTLGRPWYTWTETVNTASPGTPAAGVESWTTWRRCGVGTNEVTCPVGAVIRQQVIAEGAPTQWSYHDVLGRTVLAVSQTRHLGTANKGFSGVCTAYDAASRPLRVSEPFFLTSTAAAIEPGAFASNVCTTARQWNISTYDVLGRITAVQRPDGTGMTTTYSGLTTTTWDANGHATSQVVNALGEVVTSTDAVDLSLSFTYTPDGSIATVSRNAGRGAVTTTFGYDSLGRKTSHSDLDSGTTTLKYNALGETIEQIDASNHSVDTLLDARGRPWRQRARRWMGGAYDVESTTTFVYDTLLPGALTSQSISGGGEAQTLSHFYDVLGRPSQRNSAMDAMTFREQTQYDSLGRPWKTQDASGFWLKQEFDARGFPTKVCDSTQADTVATCGSTFYTSVEQVDARGGVTLERRGSSTGPTITRSFNALNGQLTGVCTGPSCIVQNAFYEYDNKGQITRREQAGRYAERFQYDSADRLTLGWFESIGGTWYGTTAPLVNPNATAPANMSFYAQYDKLGNVCMRHMDGLFIRFNYAGRAGCGLGGTQGTGSTSASFSAHQPTSLHVPNVVTIYNIHDARGNMTTNGDVRHYAYNVLNQATAVWRNDWANPTIRTRFVYGADGSRYRRTDDGSNVGTTTITHMVGNVERLQLPGGAIQWRRSIGNTAIVQYNGQTVSGGITQATGTGTVRHQFSDHQGTPQVIATLSGASVTVLERLDTAPNGSWRTPSPPFGQNGSTHTTKGFTGHETLAGLDTIHMNGRLYWIGAMRMFQPDPIVTQPLNPQNWNPYSYVVNNPLNFTDPSGYSFISKYWRTIVAVVVTVYSGGVASGALSGSFLGFTGANAAIAGGFVAGAVQTNSLRGGVYGAFSAWAFNGIGNHYQGLATTPGTAGTIGSTGLTAAQFTDKIIAHAFAGGVMSELQGGKFGHGFVSAGTTQALSGSIDNIDSGNAGFSAQRTLAAAALGGTVSAMTGSKFANGAVTAAFSRAFNDEAHKSSREDLENRKSALIKKINESILSNPYEDVQLGNNDFNVLTEWIYQKTLDEAYDKMNPIKFRYRMISADSVWFNGYAEAVFSIEGIAGRHLGTDINYMLQGMAWSMQGAPRWQMHSAVTQWNYAQGALGFGIRNFRQVPHAIRWADYGYDYHKNRK